MAINETLKTVFADTTEVRKKLRRLERLEPQCTYVQDAKKAWEETGVKASDFTELLDTIRPELQFLENFWTYNKFDNWKLYAWFCVPAYFDTPTSFMNVEEIETKWDLYHERRRYLEDLKRRIESLYHSWHFCTQGWDAI